MNAYFCEKTGVRIAAPGVSKSVDPEKGQDEFSESPSQPEKAAAPDKPKSNEGSKKASE